MTPFIVSITDFAITFLCMIFCWKLWTQPADKHRLNYNFLGLFAAAGIAALLGGIVHIFADRSSDLLKTLWVLTLLNVGVSSYNLWIINMRLVLTDSMFRYSAYFGRLFFLVYILFVIFVNHEFYVAVIGYIPPAVLLFIILITRAIRTKNKFYYFGIAGLLLTFLAAFIQDKKIEYLNIYIDHNSLYHIVQALGLWGLYLFGSRVSRWNL